MKKIVLYLNKQSEEVVRYAQDLVEKLEKEKVSIYIMPDISHYFKEKVKVGILEEIMDKVDLVLTIGGDGTLLRGAEIALTYHKPILGINLGRIGFLATLDKNQFGELMDILKGTQQKNIHMVLDVRVKTPKGTKKFWALNDAVLSKGNVSRVVDLDVHYNGKLLSQYRCDGMIASTPTGSTAYFLSAGGSILSPSIDAIGLIPICSHSIFNKSIIFDTKGVISISLNEANQSNVYLTLDGRESFEIFPKDEVLIEKSKKQLCILSHKNYDYYQAFRTKFIERGFHI